MAESSTHFGRSIAHCIPVFAVAGLFLSGCASVSSTLVDAKHPSDGLTYFLPRRAVVISVTVPAQASDMRTVSVTSADAVPDTSAAFVARIPRSQIAKIESSIQVNSSGLLDSESSGSTTSSLTTLLQSLAALPGGIGTRSLAPPAAASPDCSVGEHSMIASIDGASKQWDGATKSAVLTFCRVQFELIPFTGDLPASKTVPTAGKPAPGLFYRMALPYIVRATPEGRKSSEDSKDFPILSPSGSPTYFLPVARGGFGSNKVTFLFADGVPTKYGQTIDSEVVGLVQLPATVVSAYFEAIGKIFPQRKTSLENEKGYLEALNSLALAEQTRALCAEAVASKDDAKIKEACGK